MAKHLNIDMSFTANTSAAKAQIQDLQNQLTQLTNSTAARTDLPLTKDIMKAQQAAAQLKTSLDSALDQKTGKLDLSAFEKSMQRSGMSLQKYKQQLSALGSEGQRAFLGLAQSVMNADGQIRKTNKLLSEFTTTLKNTARWQISSSILHGFMSSIQQATTYVKDLNTSLTDIRIVSGLSSDEMAKFAVQANKAAKSLSTTTNEYAKASLIYYQQGLSGQDVQERADITIKMAHASGQTAQVVSDQLTAIWNNYYDGSQSLEHYADALAKLGAETASSSDEISQGLEKFSSIADMIGLSFDNAAAALATITSTTRQSADTVGTALKTIFARIQGLQLGETLEDGTTLNKYSDALNKVGINIKDQAGNLKDMDLILDEMGSKWETLDKDQQVALAQAVAGVRQYNQLVALMDNWDFYEQNLESAKNSDGTLDEQAEIYAESWQAASNRIRTSLEGLWDSLLNDQFLIKLMDDLASAIGLMEKLIDSMGGLGGVVTTLGAILTKVFNQQLSQNIANMISNLQLAAKPIAKTQLATGSSSRNMGMKEEAFQLTKNMTYDNLDAQSAAQMKSMQSQLSLQDAMSAKINQMTAAEQARYQVLLDINKAYGEQAIVAGAERDKADENYYEKREENRRKYREHEDSAYMQEMANLYTEEIRDNRMAFEASKAAANSGDDKESILKAYDDQLKAIDETTGEYILKEGSEARRLVEESANKLREDNSDDAVRKHLAQFNKTAQQEFEKAQQARIEEAEDTMREFGNSKKEKADIGKDYGESFSLADKQGSAIINSSIADLNVDKTTQGASKELEKFKIGAKSLGDTLTNAGNGIFSFVSGIQMMQSALATLNNEDMSFGEKFTSILMSMSMAIPMVIQGISSLAAAHEIGIASTFKSIAADTRSLIVKKLMGAAYTEEAAKMTLSTLAAGVNSGAIAVNSGSKTLNLTITKLLTAANGKLALSFGMVAVAAAALIAVVGILVYSYQKMSEQMKEQDLEYKMEKAKENTQAAKTAMDELNTSIEETTSSLQKLETAQESLKNLERGTEEWNEAMRTSNEEISSLLKKYPELARYINSDEYGNYTLKTGYEDIIEEANKKNQAAAQTAYLNAQATEAQAIYDYTKSELDMNKWYGVGAQAKNGEYLFTGDPVGKESNYQLVGPINKSGMTAISAMQKANEIEGSGYGVENERIDAVLEAYDTKGETVFTDEQIQKDLFAQLEGYANATEMSKHGDWNELNFQAFIDQLEANANNLKDLYSLEKQKEALNDQALVSALQAAGLNISADQYKDRGGDYEAINEEAYEAAKDKVGWVEEGKLEGEGLKAARDYGAQRGLTYLKNEGDKALYEDASGEIVEVLDEQIYNYVASIEGSAQVCADAMAQAADILVNGKGDIKGIMDQDEWNKLSEEEQQNYINTQAGLEEEYGFEASRNMMENIHSSGQGIEITETLSGLDMSSPEVQNSLKDYFDLQTGIQLDPEANLSELIDDLYDVSEAAKITEEALTELFEEGFSDEEIEAVKDSAKDLAKQYGISGKAALDMAKKQAKATKAQEEYGDSLKDNIKIAKDESKNNFERSKAYTNLKKAASAFFDIDMEDISDDAIKTAEGMDLLQEAYKGNEEAAEDWLVLSKKDMFENMDFDKMATYSGAMDGIAVSAEDLSNKISALYDMPDFNIGDKIDLSAGEGISAQAQSIYESVYSSFMAMGYSAQDAIAMTNDALGDMGMNFEGVETKEVPMKFKASSGQKAVKDEPLTIITGEGTSFQVDSYHFEPVEGEETEAMMEVPDFKNASVTRTGGGAPSHTGSNTGGGGGGGGKSKPAKRQKTTKKSDLVDRYKQLDDSMDDLTDALDEANKLSDRLWGKDRLEAMEKENELLRAQAENIRAKRVEAERYLKADKADMEAELKRLEKSTGLSLGALEYDENGNISNIESIRDKFWEKFNEKQSYWANENNFSSEEEQSEYGDENVTPLMEAWEFFKEYLDQYEETRELIEDLDAQEIDINYTLQDNNFEMLTDGFEIQIGLDDNALKLLEYYSEKLAKDWRTAAEAVAMTKEQFGYIESKLKNVSKYSNDLKTQYEIGQKAGVIPPEIQQLIDDGVKKEALYATGQLVEAGEGINQEAYIEGLETAYEEYLDNINALEDLKESMNEFYSDTLQACAEELELYTSQIEHAASSLEYFQEIVTLTNGEFDYESMGKLIDAQIRVANSSYEASMANVNRLRQDQAAIQKYIDTAKDDAEKSFWIDQLQVNQQELMAAEEKLLEDHVNQLQLYHNQAENSLKQAAHAYEMAITNNRGFDSINSSLERMGTLQDIYLTKTNQVYETQKLMRTAQSDLDKTTNEGAKLKIAAYLKETKALGEKNRLSKLELELQQAKYDVLMAEIALTEVQNAKSTMRLRRDNEGNYGYVYTANSEALTQAEQELADAENALYNISLEATNDYSQKIIELRQQMAEDLIALEEKRQNNEFENEEEYQKEMDRIRSQYNELFIAYGEEYSVATAASAEAARDAWVPKTEEMGETTEEFWKDTEEYIGKCQEINDKLVENIENMKAKFEINFGSMEQATENLATKSEELADMITGPLMEAFSAETEAVLGQLDLYAEEISMIDEMIDRYLELANAIRETLEYMGRLQSESGSTVDTSGVDYSAIMAEYYRRETANGRAFEDIQQDSIWQELIKKRQAKIGSLEEFNNNKDFYGFWEDEYFEELAKGNLSYDGKNLAEWYGNAVDLAASQGLFEAVLTDIAGGSLLDEVLSKNVYSTEEGAEEQKKLADDMKLIDLSKAMAQYFQQKVKDKEWTSYEDMQKDSDWQDLVRIRNNKINAEGGFEANKDYYGFYGDDYFKSLIKGEDTYKAWLERASQGTELKDLLQLIEEVNSTRSDASGSQSTDSNGIFGVDGNFIAGYTTVNATSSYTKTGNSLVDENGNLTAAGDTYVRSTLRLTAVESDLLDRICKGIEESAKLINSYVPTIASSVDLIKDAVIAQQQIMVEANFPNATDKETIMDAFRDISDIASQYINKN